MENLISGADALRALADGKEVEFYDELNYRWNDDIENTQMSTWIRNKFKFRLRPRTITLNGIEVPAPFEPKLGEDYWFLVAGEKNGYGFNVYSGDSEDDCYMQFGAWRTEDEIKQVVSALRKVFEVTA